jgi:hypothetical protein
MTYQEWNPSTCSDEDDGSSPRFVSLFIPPEGSAMKADVKLYELRSIMPSGTDTGAKIGSSAKQQCHSDRKMPSVLPIVLSSQTCEDDVTQLLKRDCTNGFLLNYLASTSTSTGESTEMNTMVSWMPNHTHDREALLNTMFVQVLKLKGEDSSSSDDVGTGGSADSEVQSSKTGVFCIGGMDVYSFCPMSGRMCMVNDGEVRIVDYLPSPYMLDKLRRRS